MVDSSADCEEFAQRYYVASTTRGDSDLLVLANDAIQAEERLHLALKRKKVEFEREKEASPNHDDTIHSSLKFSDQALENLKSLKAKLENRDFELKENLNLSPEVLQALRQLMMMHVPTSLTVEVVEEFQNIILTCFGGWCKEVLFAGLITCPWYQATQPERGQQAKHNEILVVFASENDEFMCPLNQHMKDQHSVIDLGWLYAAEVSHFASHLIRGKQRFVEALHLPSNAIIYQSEKWTTLRASISSELCDLKGFLEQCRGQAVGSIAKKSKTTGKMILRDASTLYELCASCRLLHQATRTLQRQSVWMDELSGCELSEMEQKALSLLQKLFQFQEKPEKATNKQEMFSHIMVWKQQVDTLMAGFKFSSIPEIRHKLGEWLIAVRDGGKCIEKPLCTDQRNREVVLDLLKKIGGPVAKMDPNQIILIAQAGSYLYNLNTPESDEDYVVIYKHPTKKLLSACSKLPECFESRGPEKSCEYGAYEARLFCEMLAKGSVVILELLFSDVSGLAYTTQAWDELDQHKHLFVTETAILQYFGLIKNNMKTIRNEKHKGSSPRERKLFYQVFHKLDSLDYFLKGLAPPVKCTGEERDFIMKIRTGKKQDEMDIKQLYELAQQRIEKLQRDLTMRNTRLPEHADTKFLTKWLMEIRGFK